MESAATQEIRRLEKRIYGNGQPGDIQRLQDCITDGLEAHRVLLERLEARIADLELLKTKGIYLFTGIGLAVGAITGGGTFSLQNLLIHIHEWTSK